MEEMQDVMLIGLAAAFVFLLILLAIIRKERLGHEWELILSTVRMTIQLILVGFILTFIFDNPTLTVYIVIKWSSRTFFNQSGQLK